MCHRMNHYYINPYGRVKIQSFKRSQQGLCPFILHKPTACGHPYASPQEGRRYEAFGRLRRGDGTASSERHVNKPHSLSKCWRKQAETFWIVIRLITACDLHPKKSDLLWQKEQTI